MKQNHRTSRGILTGTLLLVSAATIYTATAADGGLRSTTIVNQRNVVDTTQTVFTELETDSQQQRHLQKQGNGAAAAAATNNASALGVNAGGTGSSGSTTGEKPRIPAKMRASVPKAGKTLQENITPPPEVQTTSNAVFVGTCLPTQPFVFKLTGRSGKGGIGITTAAATISASFQNPNAIGTFKLYSDDKQKNFFATDIANEYPAYPYTFVDLPDDGAMIAVSCDQETEVIVTCKDDAAVAPVELTFGDVEEGATEQMVEVGGKAKGRIRNVAAYVYEDNLKAKGKKANGNKVNVRKQSDSLLALPAASVGQIVIGQLEVEDDNGKLVQRTFIKKVNARKAKPFKITIGKANINGDGDVVIPLVGPVRKRGLFYDFAARIGIYVNGTTISEDVDIQAFLESDQSEIVVHGGWIRTALQSHGLSESDAFDAIVTECYARDADKGYVVVGACESAQTLNLQQHKNRRHLVARPSLAELQITDEMLTGRRPEISVATGTSGGRRNLRDLEEISNGHAKIIVHGYCSTGATFPDNDFTPSLIYRHTYTTEAQGISHSAFAQDLWQYQYNKGLSGCGVIAHSQGGPASLTMYSR